MLFFLKKKEICDICNSNETRTQLADGYICKKCLKKNYKYVTNNKKNITVKKCKELLQIKEAKEAKIKSFREILKINCYDKILFDDDLKIMIVSRPFSKEKNIIGYDEILSFEVIEDNESLIKGGLGRAVAGGVLFGGAGAIVGAVTGTKKTKTLVKSLKIKMIFKLDYIPYLEVFFIKGGTKKNSLKYEIVTKECNKLIAKLTQILNDK